MLIMGTTTKMMSVAKRRAISDAAAQIGESISAWRRAQHMTQADLARRARTSVRTISRIESGDQAVSLAIFLSVAHTLGFLPELVAAADPARSDFGVAMLQQGLPQRVRKVG
jgi:transcriptional regulator with XRE-family HTH domain